MRRNKTWNEGKRTFGMSDGLDKLKSVVVNDSKVVVTMHICRRQRACLIPRLERLFKRPQYVVDRA